MATDDLPPNNLVFVLDVSGSMSDADKLPLLKKALALLVEQLRPQDQMAIVVYAGAARMVLSPTSGTHKATILDMLSGLEAGGSTAGGAGIRLAYELAREHFIEAGNNRVIPATDGDFNVGVSSDGELVELIELGTRVGRLPQRARLRDRQSAGRQAGNRLVTVASDDDGGARSASTRALLRL